MDMASVFEWFAQESWAAHRKYNGDSLRRLFRSKGRRCVCRCNDYSYFPTYDISGEGGKPISMSLRPSVFDCKVAPFYVTHFCQAGLYGTNKRLSVRCPSLPVKKPDHRHPRLLRACSKRPSYCRAAEMGYEPAPPHVINSEG